MTMEQSILKTVVLYNKVLGFRAAYSVFHRLIGQIDMYKDVMGRDVTYNTNKDDLITSVTFGGRCDGCISMNICDETTNSFRKHFGLCNTLKEFESALSEIYSTPLNELNCYNTVVCICYERCEDMSYVEEIVDMFYRMGYINVIEWEEIINQFELYNKLQED